MLNLADRWLFWVQWRVRGWILTDWDKKSKFAAKWALVVGSPAWDHTDELKVCCQLRSVQPFMFRLGSGLRHLKQQLKFSPSLASKAVLWQASKTQTQECKNVASFLYNTQLSYIFVNTVLKSSCFLTPQKGARVVSNVVLGILTQATAWYRTCSSRQAKKNVGINA